MIVFSYLLMTLLMFAGLFLIGLILLQRGRGGGLAGAFGGMGGQSAFGTKAGDVFTKITIGVASAWILLCAGSVVALHNSSAQLATGFADPAAIKAEDEARQKMLEKAESDQSKKNLDDENLKLPEDTEATTPATDKTIPANPDTPKTPDNKVDAETEKKAAEPVLPDPALNKPEEPAPTNPPADAEKKPAEVEPKPEEPKPEEPKTPEEPKAEQPDADAPK